MCLTLNKYAKRLIAQEDIICYKILKPDFSKYDGKGFTGVIKGVKCKGHIRIENNRVFLCTNRKPLHGAKALDKLGYKYSWIFDHYVKSIIVDEVDLMIPNKNTTFTTPFQAAKVKIGETYESGLILEEYIAWNEIEIGLHSFANYKGIRRLKCNIIVKCIIPKGSEYFIGLFDGKTSYASNKLKYIEIIK